MVEFPRIIAHRGARTEAPENTITAFKHAHKLGADGIELDVMCCATGELVVVHDYDIQYLSNGQGKVSKLSFEYLRTLDFGSHFSKDFANERIPTLIDVIETLPSNMFFNIEIKNDSWCSNGEELATTTLIKQYNLYDRVVVSSFNIFVLHRIRKIDKKVSLGFLYKTHKSYLELKIVTKLLKLHALHPNLSIFSQETLELAHKDKIQVNVWTVNDLSDMNHMVTCGVDGIITDYPNRLIELRSNKLQIKN